MADTHAMEWPEISHESEAHHAELRRERDRLRQHVDFLLDQVAVLTADPSAQRLLGKQAEARIKMIKSELCPGQPVQTAMVAR